MKREDTRRVTIADVAAHAHVSETTVSHVLSARRPVAAKTRERVRESIETLGYRPNVIARSLRIQRTQTVAIIFPNIAHVVYPKVARGASRVLRPLGYQVALYDTDDDPATELEVIRTVVDRVTDGAMLFGVNVSQTAADTLNENGIAFVNGGVHGESLGAWDAVMSDQAAGVKEAVLHLASRFSGPIAFLGGEGGDGAAVVRESGYRQALEALGMPYDESLVVRAPYSLEGGRRAMHKLLARGVNPRSICCANDLIAIGAMAVAREHGIRVPDDIAFTGFDNDEATLVVSPPLTSIETDLDAQGRVSAELLLERMTGAYSGAPRRLLLPTTLVVRESSGGTLD